MSMYADALESQLASTSTSEPASLTELGARLDNGPAPALLSRIWNDVKFVEYPQPAGAPAPAADEEDDAEPVDDLVAVAVQRGKDQAERQLRRGEPPFRPTALYVTSLSVSRMNTQQILALFADIFDDDTSKPIVPIGLEWIDDQSIALLFKDEVDATLGWHYLTGIPLETNGVDRLIERPLETIVELDSPFLIRQALIADVKAKDAAKRSQFYKQQRREIRQSKPYDRPERGRRGRPSKTATDLDAELEAYLKGDEAAPPVEAGSSAGTKNLDDDMDAYMNGRPEREE